MKFLKFDSMATILIMDWGLRAGTLLTQHVDCLELDCLATATAGDKLEEFSGTVARPGPEDGGIAAVERNIENPETDRHHDR